VLTTKDLEEGLASINQSIKNAPPEIAIRLDIMAVLLMRLIDISKAKEELQEHIILQTRRAL
jgi:hypothetical protein